KPRRLASRTSRSRIGRNPVFSHHGFRLLQFLQWPTDHHRPRFGTGEGKQNQTHHTAVSTPLNKMNIHTQTVINKTWNPAKGAFEYSFAFPFTTKAQYLEFRRLWKENYALLTVSLRAQKALIKSTMRQR